MAADSFWGRDKLVGDGELSRVTATEDYRLGAVSGAARGCELLYWRLPAGSSERSGRRLRARTGEGRRARRRLRAFLVSRLALRRNWNRSPFSRAIRSHTENHFVCLVT